LIVAVTSFLIAKRYWGAVVFGKAYLALGIAFTMLVLAETTYIVYDFVLEEDPYPSIADVFYFLFYPLVLYHLIINIRFFNPKQSIKTKAWMIAIAASIIIIYSVFAYQVIEEFNFDYYYGVIFVSIAAITLPYTILGAMSFKGGTLGVAWLILVIGMLSLVIGDTIYYYQELFGAYTEVDPVNLFWIGGYLVMVYALYKHQEAI